MVDVIAYSRDDEISIRLLFSTEMDRCI